MWTSFRSPLTQLTRQRQQLLSTSDTLPELIQKLLNEPLPEPQTPVQQLDILVLDFETSGLDPTQDQVLSMGWVSICSGVIELKSAHYCLLHQSQTSQETVVIHQLRPETLARAGITEQDAFDKLLVAMQGKIVVAHGCVIEKRFFDDYIARHFGLSSLPILWLDTLKIEQFRQKRSHQPIDWRLSTVRQRLKLPEHSAHHALNDAIATAEVYLALIYHLFGRSAAPLEHLLKASA